MGTLTNETTLTQNNMIREHLLHFGEIDKKAALMICDCDRISARIWDLRHIYGMNIETVRVTKKNRFGHAETHAIYKLVRGETA